MTTRRIQLTRREVLMGSAALAGSAAVGALGQPSLVQPAGAQGASDGLTGLSSQHSTTESAITSQNVGDLGFAWSILTQTEVSGMPIVADGRVYFTEWGGTVYAADVANGQVVWQNQIHQPNMKWPWHGLAGPGTLSEGTLYYGAVEGKAFAVNAENGEVMWEAQIAEDEHAGSLAKPLVHNGLVYFGLSSVEEPLSAQVPDFQPNFQGKVLALDAETGEQVWQQALVDPPQNGVPVWGGFALDPDLNLLYFATGNNYTGEASELSDAMIAVDASTGEIRWSRQVTEHDIWTVAEPKGPDIDFGVAPQLFTATVDGQTRELVGAGSKGGVFYAFERETGELVWATQVGYGGIGGGVRGEASIGDGTLYLWSNNYWTDTITTPKDPEAQPISVKALDAATGEIQWYINRTQSAIGWAAGYLANDVYFVGDLAGTVQAYAAADGQPLWSTQVPGAIGAALVVSGDSLFVGAGVPPAFGGHKPFGLFVYQLGATGTPPAGPASPEAAEASPAASPAAEANVVQVEELAYDIRMPRELPAGETTFVVTNVGTIVHNFEIEGQGIEREFEENLQPGETKMMTVDLEPGTYEVYCPVDNHAELGMRFELTVTD